VSVEENNKPIAAYWVFNNPKRFYVSSPEKMAVAICEDAIRFGEPLNGKISLEEIRKIELKGGTIRITCDDFEVVFAAASFIRSGKIDMDLNFEIAMLLYGLLYLNGKNISGEVHRMDSLPKRRENAFYYILVVFLSVVTIALLELMVHAALGLSLIFGIVFLVLSFIAEKFFRKFLFPGRNRAILVNALSHIHRYDYATGARFLEDFLKHSKTTDINRISVGVLSIMIGNVSVAVKSLDDVKENNNNVPTVKFAKALLEKMGKNIPQQST